MAVHQFQSTVQLALYSSTCNLMWVGYTCIELYSYYYRPIEYIDCSCYIYFIISNEMVAVEAVP